MGPAVTPEVVMVSVTMDPNTDVTWTWAGKALPTGTPLNSRK